MKRMFTPATNQKYNKKIAEKSYVQKTKNANMLHPSESKVIYEENESDFKTTVIANSPEQ